MVDDDQLKRWFQREIFPLESALTKYLVRNWRNPGEICDLRQEIYVRLYASARERLPRQAKPFLFAVARNHLVNLAKRAQIVPLDYVADLESSGDLLDEETPERRFDARSELRLVQAGLEKLPPRCRQVVELRKVEGLTTREAAERMNVGLDTIERQLVLGMRALVEFMLGGSGKIRRKEPFRQRQGKRSGL
jgi:RNA polymerase sigma factor (sigma-70 family)